MAEDDEKRDITIDRDHWGPEVLLFQDWLTKQYPHFDICWCHEHRPSLNSEIWEALGKLGKMDDVGLGELIDHLSHIERLVRRAHDAKRAKMAKDRENGVH